MEPEKFFIAAAVAVSMVFIIAESFEFHEHELVSEETLWDMYERWRAHHTVTRSIDERRARFNVFKHNAMHVHNTNKEARPYKLKLNRFADMTNHEFRTAYAGSKVDHHRMFRGTRTGPWQFMYENVSSVPASVDWRKEGAVSAVKNQGQCGGCWAFSTVAAVEGINYIKTKNLISLSEQELIDCDTTKNKGCNGGLMDYAFEYIKERGGITMESVYPYRAATGACDGHKENAPFVSIDRHENVPQNNEEALLKTVANQPVSVAIDVSGTDLQLYSEGVFSGRCGTNLNHGVAVVGYGTTPEGTKYWIVRNSWGPEWGDKGYLRIERGVSAKEGHCGIAMEASYPIKSSSIYPEGRASSTVKDEL